MAIGAAPRRRGARGSFRWSPVDVFVGSFALSLAAALAVMASSRARDQARFEAAVTRTRGRLEARLETYVSMLRGLAGLYAYRAPRERHEFAAYVEKLEIGTYYPGIQGLGFSARLTAKEREDLVRRRRAQGDREFRVWPDGGGGEHHAIVFLEPLDRRNRAALGYDMATEPIRREAMERARDTGSPARSGRVTWVQEIENPKQPGFLIYVPVYAGGRVPPSLDERRALLMGYAYSPFRAEDLFRAVLGATEAGGVGCSIYDGERAEPDALFYRSDDEAAQAALRRIERLTVGGRPLTVAFFSTLTFRGWSGPGLALALLAFGLVGGTALSLSARSEAQARAKAEESRRDAELQRQRLHALVTQAPAIIVITHGPEHACVLSNSMSRLWTGEGNRSGENARVFLAEMNASVAAALDDVYRTGQPWVWTEIHVTARSAESPREGFFDGAIQPLRGADGEIEGLFFFAIDVTAQVRARRCEERLVQQLQFERDRLDAILRAVADGVTVQDKSGRLVFANDAAARISGFSDAREMLASTPEQILERFEILDEQGQPFAHSRLPGRRVLEGEGAGEVLLRVRHKHTGRDFYSIVTAGPVYGPRGDVELAINVFRDITERKNTEDWWHFLADATAVLSSSLDYEITLERVAQMAVPHLGDWCAVDMSAGAPGLARRLAVAHVDPAKVTFARQLHERYPSDPDSPHGLARVLRTGEPELYPEISDELLVASARDPEHLRISRELGLKSALLVPLKIGDRVLGVITIVAAESHRRYGAVDLASAMELARRAALAVENARLYREAQAAIRRRDEFLSVASHELKTPLSSVHLQVQSLLRLLVKAGPQGFPPDKLAAKLSRADTQLGKLTALINQLLDVTYIVSGQLTMRPRPTDFAAVVREVAARLESAAEAAGCTLELSLESSVLGSWDPDRLEQVVTNLLSNALKYGAGEPVEITLRRSGPQALLTVRDRGPGIDVSDQARIFERFERASPLRHYAGLGLGLWIARQIVLAHGGEICVESAPGRGASFTVRLPVTAADTGGAAGS